MAFSKDLSLMAKLALIPALPVGLGLYGYGVEKHIEHVEVVAPFIGSVIYLIALAGLFNLAKNDRSSSLD